MSITDEDFNDWLTSNNQHRVVLVNYSYILGGDLVQGYASNYSYLTSPTDTPANAVYEQIINDDIIYSRAVNYDAYSGFSTSRGEINLTLTDENMADLIAAQFSKQPISVLIGDKSWPIDNFRAQMVGVVKNKSVKNNKLVLTLRDDSEFFDKPFPMTQITVGGQETYKPICLGDCKNISPILVDQGDMEYMICESEIRSISEVRDDGVSVDYIFSMPNNGLFRLEDSPVGTVTVDCIGLQYGSETPTDTRSSDVIRLAQFIFEYYAGFTGSKIDTDSFDDTTRIEFIHQVSSGFYITDPKTTMLSVVNILLRSFNSFWYFSRTGVLKVRQLYKEGETSKGTIQRSMIAQNGVSIKMFIDPEYSLNLKYSRNWKAQSSFASSVDLESRELYSKDFRTWTEEDSSILADYPYANEGISKELYINHVKTVSLEPSYVEYLLTLADVPRIIYEIQLLVTPEFEIGDIYKFDYDLIGFDKTKDYTILSSRESIMTGRSTVEVICDQF